ncbi:MAG: hypothetical protein L0H83_03390 [Salinisphaera sp.]|nr:hypothetical protein [Salinisphaera sp.]
MSASIATTDINATIQRALSAGNVLGKPALYNRRCRRAMRKRRKSVSRPLAVTPRLGAAPRGPARRQGSGTSRTRKPEAGPSRTGMPAQPTFTPLPSDLAFGPPADISMGWDGTLWAIDASGAPHLYDPTKNAWQPHGDGIDAAAWIDTTYYFFRGNEVVTAEYYQNTGTPQPIATLFPNLPDSFKLGITAAANIGGKLYLFKGGWYLPADGSAPRAKLTDLKNWPQTPNWVDGLIDTTSFDGGTVFGLIRGGEYITVDFAAKTVTTSPAPIGSFGPWQGHLPADWASSGFDAAFTQSLNNTTTSTFFKGTAMVEFRPSDTGIATRKYLGARYPNWPATWNPVLNHAPSGRVGNLWSVLPSTQASYIMQHNGEAWTQQPNQADHVSAGQDGTVMIASADKLCRWNGAGWDTLARLNGFIQVAVGDANHVWGRDTDNNVHRFDTTNNTFTQATQVGTAAHIAANADGTLWHCNSSNANVYRFISEATAASAAIPVRQSSVTSVHKVASTGFGAAHCLAQGSDGSTQVYRYDSPYVFKTSKPYVLHGNAPMVQGLGRLCFVQQVSYPMPGHVNVRFVALDAHTGQEIASYTPPGNTTEYTGLVFDPINDLVYVGAAPADLDYDNTTPGQLIALDVHTLAVKWTFQTAAGVDGTPALSGTQLCFGDRTGTVYLFDTRDALANVAAPTPKWTWTVTNWSGLVPPTTQRTATPVLANGLVHAVAWGVWNSDPALAWLVVARCNAQDGGNQEIEFSFPVTSPVVDGAALESYAHAPILGTASIAGKAQPALFISGGNAVYTVPLVPSPSQPNANASFVLPAGRIVTGFAYDDGTRAGTGLSSTGPSPDAIRLWFGDNEGNLWSLNNSLHPVDNTPYNLGPQSSIFTTPVLYKNPQGGLTVLFGASSSGLIPMAQPPSLYGYDPKAGQHASVPTGVTYIWSLSQGVTNGVVYAAGGGNATPDGQVSQVFCLRVDELPQALRDFIIESQLMQDPDQNAQGGSTDPNNPIPPSVARYQTHLTVVDDQKNPQPYEPVKIWADKPNTTITVDGQPFTIGPGDTQYASVKTGLDGSLVIVSDASDMFATPLRVWAGFMDPYERIVVNPDQEFHARVTTAHAVANDDDPDKANLQTAHNYNGQPLFTDGEKSQNQPKNCADAVGQMNKGVGLSGGASKATFVKVMRAITGGYSTAEAGAAPQIDKYLAYADLTGASHFPANIPALRPANVAAPVGLRFARPQDGKSSPPAFAAMHHTDALAAIDALPSTKPDAPWLKSALSAQSADGAFTVRRTDDLFTDFWNWLKGAVQQAVAYITHIIVAVAEDVVVCIRMIVNGIEQVFKAIIKVVEDIAAAIGSFFQMLEKLIEDVIAALSVLFHFGEIIHTHKWIRDQINANLQQAIGAMQNQVKPPVDQFFQQGEQAITTLFSNIRQQLGINDDTQINSLNSAGSTAHTAFTAGPGAVGPTSGGNSHAVQCTHTTQKMKNGLPSAAQPGHSVLSLSKDAPAIADDDDDALSAFVTNFVNSLQTNPAISTAFNNLKSAINNIGQSQSAGDFFKSALSLLLTLVEDLILGMVAVTQALVDGLIGAIQALINTVVSLLNTPVDIPFLSWLYQLIFGEPLTILNAVSLVAAIPVTIIYRVVEGRYPSEDGITGTAVTSAALTQPRRTAVSADVIKKMQGLIGGTIAIGLGIARAVVDLAGPAPPRIGTIFVLTFGVAYVSTYFPLMIPGAVPTATQWAEWGLGAGLALLGTFGVINLKGLQAATQALFKVVLTFLRVGLGIARFIVFIVAFATSGNRNVVTNVQFARNLFLELPPMFNWLKLLADPANVVLTGIDAVTGVVVCALDITAAFLNTEPDPRRQRPLMA